MKCLVTGGTGFLGRHVVRQLLAAGHTVRVLVRSDALSLEREGAQLVRGDVLDPAGLAPAIAGADVVLHLAGRVDHQDAQSALFELHVEGTRNVLAAAAAGGVGRFVHVSTSGTIAVSRDPHEIADEEAPYALEAVRRWPYYLSKIYAEKVALEAHAAGEVPVVVLNPTLLLGPEDDGLSSSRAIVSFLRRELPVSPAGGLSFVDVRDAAAAAVAAAAGQGRPGERYLLGGPNMTFEAFFVLLGRVSGVPAPALRASVRATDVAARVIGALEDVGGLEGDESVSYAMANRYWYLDARKAKAELGFSPRAPEATLKDSVAWIRSRGPLPASRGTVGSMVRGFQRAFGRI